MIALKGPIKQVQHLSGKLDRHSSGKLDHYTATANYFDKLIKTISRVVPIVYLSTKKAR